MAIAQSNVAETWQVQQTRKCATIPKSGQKAFLFPISINMCILLGILEVVFMQWKWMSPLTFLILSAVALASNPQGRTDRP